MADEKSTSTKKPNIGLIAGIVAAIVVIVVAIVVVVLNATPKIIGKYELSATIDKDGKESTEMVSFMKALGGTQTIEFKKDKTGSIDSKAGESTSSIKFTYDDKELKAKNEDSGEEAVYSYEYKDDVVTITLKAEGEENEKMKFTRVKE